MDSYGYGNSLGGGSFGRGGFSRGGRGGYNKSSSYNFDNLPLASDENHKYEAITKDFYKVRSIFASEKLLLAQPLARLFLQASRDTPSFKGCRRRFAVGEPG